MADVKWIKIAVTMFYDEKIKLIEQMKDADGILAIYFKILLKARRNEYRRYFYRISENVELDDNTMAWMIERPIDSVIHALETLEKLSLIKRYGNKIEVFRFWEDEQRNRNTPEYIYWRISVFKRDSYKCKKCSDTQKINAHHIDSWATHKELRFDINNGITLCEKCHKKIHKKIRGDNRG